MATQAPSLQPTGQGEVTTCTAADPVGTARSAGLRYVTDHMAGIQRKRAGKHFRYLGLDGKPIRDPDELQRIRSLGIPPAWTNVWICPRQNGHIQATGRDTRGRKQYRYHPRWREVRDATKYDHLVAFGHALPALREHTSLHLSLTGLSRDKVLATVVRLLDTTLIRVGNEEYVRENGTFGLTTMRNDHVDISGSNVQFHFRGKSGKEHVVDVKDRQLARIVKRCQDLPGHELFQYIDENGEQRTIESDDVNTYLRQVTEQDFTAKDFRTWGGTVITVSTLYEIGEFESETEARKNITQAIKIAAELLGNTPAICRKCYVHPGVLDAYMEGSLLNFLRQQTTTERIETADGLRPEESMLLAFLQQESARAV